MRINFQGEPPLSSNLSFFQKSILIWSKSLFHFLRLSLSNNMLAEKKSWSRLDSLHKDMGCWFLKLMLYYIQLFAHRRKEATTKTINKKSLCFQLLAKGLVVCCQVYLLCFKPVWPVEVLIFICMLRFFCFNSYNNLIVFITRNHKSLSPYSVGSQW